MNVIKPALITPGDPSGIGPEIALKAWSEGQKNIVLMGDIEHLSSVALAAGLNIPSHLLIPPSVCQLKNAAFGKLTGRLCLRWAA